MEEQSQPSGVYRFRKEKADDGSNCFILEKARKTVKGGKKLIQYRRIKIESIY